MASYIGSTMSDFAFFEYGPGSVGNNTFFEKANLTIVPGRPGSERIRVAYIDDGGNDDFEVQGNADALTPTNVTVRLYRAGHYYE